MSWKQTAAFQQKYAKKDAIRVANALNQAGIDCELESEIPREGETNPRGLQKFYYVDVTVVDPLVQKVGIEMDGRAHNGREAEDMEKDEYLKRHGYYAILRFPNRTPSEKVVQAVLGFRRGYE